MPALVAAVTDPRPRVERRPAAGFTPAIERAWVPRLARLHRAVQSGFARPLVACVMPPAGVPR